MVMTFETAGPHLNGYTYVNRGIGTLVFPFRIGAPPEITCFTLQNYGSVQKNRKKENTIFI